MIHSDQMVYCNVLGCRYPNTHSSIAHKCGTCQRFGHGILECRDRQAKTLLFNTSNYATALPTNIQCIVPNCSQRWSHTTEAHHCSDCGRRGGDHASDCTSNVVQDATADSTSTINIQCPHCKQYSNVDLNFQVFTGGDCTICANQTRMVVFATCKHANICKDCAIRIRDL